MSANLLAGVATRDITPPLGEWMGGYFHREQGCTGVREPLSLTALCMEDAKEHLVVLVGADLLGFPQVVTRQIRDELTREWPGRAFTLLLNASHTHCGPATCPSTLSPPIPRRPPEIYLRFLQESTRSAILDAWRARRPMALAWRTAEARLSMNRRLVRNGVCEFAPNPEGAIDPRVTVWSLHEKKDARASVVWFTYSCHPTTHDGYLISPDWPGHARKHLQRSLGEGVVALFTQGTCGEIRPPWTPGQPGTPAQAEAMGTQLAAVVAASLERGTFLSEVSFRAAEGAIALPFAGWPAEEDLRRYEAEEVDLAWCRARWPAGAFLAERKFAPIRRLWTARMRQRRASGDGERPLELGVTLVEIAPGRRLLAMEGEVCFDLAEKIRQGLGAPELQILGYTNDVSAYIPSERILREGGYEGQDSQIFFGQPARFAAGIEERVIAGVRELDRKLKGDA